MKYIDGLIKKKLSKWTGKKWYHQRFDGSPYFMYLIAEAEIVTDLEKKQGAEFDVHYCFYDSGKADWYIEMEDIKKVYSAIIENGKNKLSFGKELMKKWEPAEKKFYTFCKKIGSIELSLLSDKELLKLHDDFLETILSRNSSSSLIDGFALGTDELLSDMIKKTYNSSPLKSKIKWNDLFSSLTAPIHPSFINRAEMELLKIADVAKKSLDEADELLIKHQKDFFWIQNNYVNAHIISIEEFKEEVEKIISSKMNIQEQIEKIENTPVKNKERKEALLKDFPLDPQTKFILQISEDFTKWQDDRKKATLFTMHYGSLILNEIGKRIGIPLELLKYMSPREMSNVFAVVPEKSSLEERKRNSVFYWDKEGYEVFFGDEAESVKKTILGTTDISDVNDFRGLTACLGRVTGIAKVVKSVTEMGKVEKGDVLIAVMTRPDYVPAMKNALAIVTDEGGITCHAAIVSRELGKPCIIGTKIATKVLKDGDIVEVDADHGVVRILNK